MLANREEMDQDKILQMLGVYLSSKLPALHQTAVPDILATIDEFIALDREDMIASSDAVVTVAIADGTIFTCRARVELLSMSTEITDPATLKDVRNFPDSALKLLFSFMQGLGQHAMRGKPDESNQGNSDPRAEKDSGAGSGQTDPDPTNG